MKNEIGIEYIGISTSNAVFDLELLAKKKKIDVSKYKQGLCQEKMSVITPTEDIITLGFEAVCDINSIVDNKYKNFLEGIGLLLFATESAVDNSKSSACELHNLLKQKFNLVSNCRCIDVKHACYGGTGALMLAKDFVIANPNKKALVIMSDIAFYGLNTAGEPTQGCGAVAVVISNKPNIATFCDDGVYITENKNDFYRPTFCQKPIYDGHNSIKCYLSMFKQSVIEYKKQNNNIFNVDYLITHQPFTKMLDKCCNEIKLNTNTNNNNAIKKYNKIIGNSYTASLYIGLLSLLENSTKDLTNKQIAMFSYGSGAECELFSIKIIKGYDKYLNKDKHIHLLSNRVELSYKQYKQYLKNFQKREQKLNWKCENQYKKLHSKQQIILEKIVNGVRYYNIIY